MIQSLGLFALLVVAVQHWRDATGTPSGGAPSASLTPIPDPCAEGFLRADTRCDTRWTGNEWASRGRAAAAWWASRTLAMSRDEGIVVATRFYDGQVEFGQPRRMISLGDDVRYASNTASQDTDPVRNAGLKSSPELTREMSSAQNVTNSVWPRPESLHARLAELQSAVAVPWVEAVNQELQALANSGALDAATVPHHLQQLWALTVDVDRWADQVRGYEEQVLVRSIQYALERRIAVWSAVHDAARSETRGVLAEVRQTIDPTTVRHQLAAVKSTLGETPNGNDWATFLALQPLQDALDEDQVGLSAALACRVLQHLESVQLSEAQVRFLQARPLKEYQELLKRLATTEVDLTALLREVEALEAMPHPLRQARLAAAWNQLRFSQAAAHQQLAEVLDLHYRNANVRFSMTEDFANSFLPAVQHARGPVREQILGADVQGQSTSLTQIRVRFIPDPDEIQIKLEAQGTMSAMTHSSKGAVTLFNQNRSRFIVQKLLALDHRGVRVGRTEAAASADTALTGMATRYDMFPFLGTMVRRIARQKHYQTKPLATQILNGRIAYRARQRIDGQLEQQMLAARQRLESRVIHPLQEMALSPAALSMYTTQDRIVFRGRLAGTDQMAACSARPRALADAQLSIQVHESALNNFFAQMQLGGREVGLRTLCREILDEWNLQSVEIPEEIQDDIRITFVHRQPVLVRLDQDRIRFELAIKQLATENDRWRNFKVCVHYAPVAEGFSCDLHRDGVVELQSLTRHNLRGGDRLALAAIFTRVFSQNRPIKLVNDRLKNDPRLAKLDIQQCVIRDGWIGFSVCPEVATSVGQRAPTPSRTPRKLR